MKKIRQQFTEKNLIVNGNNNKVSMTERKNYFSWMSKILLLLMILSFIFVFSETNKKWQKSKGKLIPYRIIKELNLTEEQKKILKQNAVENLSLRKQRKKKRLEKMKRRLNFYQIIIDHFSKPSLNEAKCIQAVQQEIEKNFAKDKKYNFLSQRVDNQIIFFESLNANQKEKVEKWLQKGLENKMKRGKKKNKKWQEYKLIDVRVLNKIPREINFSDDQRKIYIKFFPEIKNQKEKKLDNKKSKRKKLSITKEVFEATKNKKMSDKEKKKLISKVQQNKKNEYEQKRKEKKKKSKKEVSQLFDLFESLDEEQKKKVIALIKSEKEKEEKKFKKKSNKILNKKN